MQLINTRSEFTALAAELGVRPDWHEPDEQEVSARVEGDRLDNATGASGACGELRVVITRDGEPVAAVNLASLCAWASVPVDEVASFERRERRWLYGTPDVCPVCKLIAPCGDDHEREA